MHETLVTVAAGLELWVHLPKSSKGTVGDATRITPVAYHTQQLSPGISMLALHRVTCRGVCYNWKVHHSVVEKSCGYTPKVVQYPGLQVSAGDE